MVFNKFTHLARPSLSKTFAHGYAQSVVAATQSTTPFSPLSKHPSNKSSRPSTAQQHTPFSSLTTANTSSGRAAQPPSDVTSNDGGLKAYYDAWQRLQQHGGEGKEWRQYQFPKLIEPKAPAKIKDGQGKGHVPGPAPVDDTAERGALDRAYSTSAVDDIKKAQDEVEGIAVAKVNAAIATVIEQIKQSSTDQHEAQKAISEPAQKEAAPSILANTDMPANDSSVSPVSKDDVSIRSSPLSDVTAATSTQSDLDSIAYLRYISELNDAQAYKDIPPAFESMLSRAIKPTPEAYNALLNSAIHLPVGRLQLFSKALDIYSDMLRRKVIPDTGFYNTLIQILSDRALEAGQKTVDLDRQSRRYGGKNSIGTFLLASDTAEYAMLAEDDAFDNAIRLFNKAISAPGDHRFSTEMYELLILACAQRQSVDDMVGVYHHLESQKVTPSAAIFPAMITAFAKSGDLSSSLECYNEYRSLAMADDVGQFSIFGRLDHEVYAALVKAHNLCDRPDGGERFFDRIVSNFVTDTKEREIHLEQIRDTVTIEAFIQQHLDTGDFPAAIAVANNHPLSSRAREQAYLRICITAADASNVEVATKAYRFLTSGSSISAASIAMLALYVRERDMQAASEVWTTLNSTVDFGPWLVTPTVLYGNALIRNDQIDTASSISRETFARIRASSLARSPPADVTDTLDEAIEAIARSILKTGKTVPVTASVNLLRAMIENGGLISHVAEQVLADLGPEQVSSLNWQDMMMALQVQAGFIGNSKHDVDVIHASRFENLLDMATGSGATLDERTTELVDTASRKLSLIHPEIAAKWHNYQQISLVPSPLSYTPLPSPAIQSAPTLADKNDPYAATTDYRGSTIIIEQLESHRNSHGLNEALTRFRNIRRAGRHPRYIAYAKLITVAAKEGRVNLIHDVLGMARHDIPLLVQYSVVRHGWSSILDAMVGACLTAGRRALAEQFHQELLDMGSTPTANTYGLYITTLKASTKTFDEATEAIRIFHRAVADGVQPSSFLYNALIGKLGKARRIDDCLRYFQEMRAAGIRPTSVTYGTIVNALCRVSDERFAEELFDEMESASNYKPRPAPYNSLMQYFLNTKRDSQMVLNYYKRMQSMSIQPTMHTYKLLIDTYATLEPVNLEAAEGVLETIRAQGLRPEAVHYASLIHAKGCALHDMKGAREVFDNVLRSGELKPQACLYQALFESMVANHCVAETEKVLDSMSANEVEMTPYIANTLIHGWAMEHRIATSKAIYDSVNVEKREPSTYESMTRAFLTAEDRKGALTIVHEMLSRGYPSAVSNKILELVGHSVGRAGSAVLSGAII